MKKILLIARTPPPIGGITIHVDRFINITQNRFALGVLDLKKKVLICKDTKVNNFWGILKFIIQSKIVHVHVSNSKLVICLLLLAKLLFKKTVYTHHNSIIKNQKMFLLICKLSNKIILVNNKEIDDDLINWSKTEIIPAFLPPYKSEELPNSLVDIIKKFDNVLSTNCFMYNMFKGKHVYGFDLIIEAFHKLASSDKIKNTLLILVDPSNTTKDFVNEYLDKLSFKSNKIILITEKIDFVSLIKQSTLTIRATRTDGDSLSIRESLYYNVPIIASDVTTRPKETIVFKSDDVDDLSSKIDFSLRDIRNIKYNNIDFGALVLDLYEKILNTKNITEKLQ